MASDASSEIRQGGCACGRTRFEARGAPKFVANCHCASCRRATGASMSSFVGFKSEQVTWSGEAPAIFASSPGVERRFCSACGTALSYAGEKWAGETHLILGAFDDPRAFTPTAEAFKEEALDWLK